MGLGDIPSIGRRIEGHVLWLSWLIAPPPRSRKDRHCSKGKFGADLFASAFRLINSQRGDCDTPQFPTPTKSAIGQPVRFED